MASTPLDPDLARRPANAAHVSAAIFRGPERAAQAMNLSGARVSALATTARVPRPRHRQDLQRDPAPSRSIQPESAVSFIAAILLHALLLYGFWLATPFHPPALTEEPSPVNVSLIADAPPALAEGIPTPEPIAPRTSMPPPEPQPAPEQKSLPAPEASAQELILEDTPITTLQKITPAPETAAAPAHLKPPPRHQEQKHSSAPHSAAGMAASAAGATSHGATGGPPSSRASYLSNPKPDYPAEARRLRQEGMVVVSVEVGEDGRASDAALKRSSGFPLLDEAAVQAVRRWTFEPARAGGIAVSSRVDVPVRFSLLQ